MRPLYEIQTHSGENLIELSSNGPLMLIFLRHFGCVFCKEALNDLADLQIPIKEKKTRLVFVHMSKPEVAKGYFQEFGLKDVFQISDPDRKLYSEFNLGRGSFTQLFGLQSWIKGYKVSKNKGLKAARPENISDSLQMPGIFVIFKGEILKSYFHNTIYETPDYLNLIDACTLG